MSVPGRRQRLRRLLFAAVPIAALAIVLVFAGRRRVYPVTQENLMARIPVQAGLAQEGLVVDAGFGGLLGGILWLRYQATMGAWLYGGMTEAQWDWVAAENFLITALEPKYLDPVLFASSVLSEHRLETAHKIMLLGLRHQAGEYRLYQYLSYLIGFDYGQRTRAGYWMAMAAYFPDLPEWMALAARKLLVRKGAQLDESVLALTRDKLGRFRATDDRVEDMERFYQLKQRLDADLEQYRAAHGRYPRALTEMVEGGYWIGIPRDSWGGRVRLNETGDRIVPSTRFPLWIKPHEPKPIPAELRSGTWVRRFHW